jgi:outer membrane murein-binding lipoprotein Lpp
MYYAAILLAVGAAMVFSAFKGIGFFRSRFYSAVVEEEMPSLAEAQEKERIEKHNFMVEEMKNANLRLVNQTAHLQNQLRERDSRKQIEALLRKSHSALERKCEKLAAEKETLVMNTMPLLMETKPARPRAKAAKKEVSRKPKRVSKKKR